MIANWINLKSYFFEMYFLGKITKEEYLNKLSFMKTNQVEVIEPILVLPNGQEVIIK